MKMNSPKVDIIIPAYNQGHYLRESVESALAQTWENLEVIIIDDGSTDNTAEVGQSFDDPRVTYIFQQNKGQHNRFSKEQIDWLRMIKDHVTSSYHIEIDDLDYTPFDAKGGRGKMYQLFGNQMNDIINELNEVLAA